MRTPRYSADKHARRGKEIYEQSIRPQIENQIGKIVAIDVDTGEFELGENTLDASEKLLSRLPDAQIWCLRIGHVAVHRFGARNTPCVGMGGLDDEQLALAKDEDFWKLIAERRRQKTISRAELEARLTAQK